MMRKTATLLASAALAAVPAMAVGAEERPSFADVDANGDGKISVSEAVDAGVPKQEAKREDIDNDGKLTKADWKFVDMDAESSESGS